MPDFFPTIQLLDQLVPGLEQIQIPRENLDGKNTETYSKKIQNCLGLLQTATLRLFIVNSLYNEESEYYLVSLDEWFSYAEWQKKIQDKSPQLPKLTIREFLDLDNTEQGINLLTTKIQNRYYLSQKQIDSWLDYFLFTGEGLENKSNQARTLRNNFTSLTKLKEPLLLKQSRGKYKKLSLDEIYNYLEKQSQSLGENQKELTEYANNSFIDLINQDFSVIVELLLEKIKGKQRLFIYHDYIVPKDLQELSATVASRLQLVWRETPVPPIKIDYYSSSLDQKGSYIIYPVCIYYYRRAYYLTAFGQTPYSQQLGKNQWYNYRLEKISNLEKLSWSTPNLPLLATEILAEEAKYSTDYINQEFKDAYGFDFYQPSELMLLKFDPNFSRRYIENSFRHETFEKIEDIQQVINLIRYAKVPEEEQLLAKIKRDYDYSYYALNYRQQDNNVIMRLRAWIPNVEVLLPYQLRKIMRDDLAKAYKFYCDTIIIK